MGELRLSEAAAEKQAAVFLTCIRAEAYDVYRAMNFATDDDRKKTAPIIGEHGVG